MNAEEQKNVLFAAGFINGQLIPHPAALGRPLKLYSRGMIEWCLNRALYQGETVEQASNRHPWWRLAQRRRARYLLGFYRELVDRYRAELARRDRA